MHICMSMKPASCNQASAWKKILRENRETGGFLIEPVRIFECFLGQRNAKILTFLIRTGIQQWKKQRKSGIYEKSVKKEGGERPLSEAKAPERPLFSRVLSHKTMFFFYFPFMLNPCILRQRTIVQRFLHRWWWFLSTLPWHQTAPCVKTMLL